jgi:hypothetical protein
MTLANAAWRIAPALGKRVVDVCMDTSMQFELELEPRGERRAGGAGRTGARRASGGCLC